MSFILESRQPCEVSRPSFQGECVLFSDCPFANNIPDFLTSDTFNEIRERSNACNRGSFCCERSRGSSVTPVPAITVTPQRESVPSRIDGDLENHPNYRFFKDLRCGTSYTDRISNGEFNDLTNHSI